MNATTELISEDMLELSAGILEAVKKAFDKGATKSEVGGVLGGMAVSMLIASGASDDDVMGFTSSMLAKSRNLPKQKALETYEEFKTRVARELNIHLPSGEKSS